MGGKPDENVEQALPEGFGSSFSDQNIRRTFIRKVYSILLVQLLVTTGIIALFIFTPALRGVYCLNANEAWDIKARCHPNDNALIMYIISYVIFIIFYIAIACCEGVRRKYPLNVIALSVFTLALSFMAASIALFHSVTWVMMAMGITAAVCLGITLFSFQTKIDFTGIGFYLITACWVLFLFGILIIIFWARDLPVLWTVYSGLVALLFSMFLVYDTQLLLGGKKKYALSPEEHILVQSTCTLMLFTFSWPSSEWAGEIKARPPPTRFSNNC